MGISIAPRLTRPELNAASIAPGSAVLRGAGVAPPSGDSAMLRADHGSTRLGQMSGNGANPPSEAGSGQRKLRNGQPSCTMSGFVLPRAGVGVQIEELLGGDVAVDQRSQSVLHTNVVPRAVGVAIRVPSVHVVGVAVVGPLHGSLLFGGDAVGGAEVRVQRQRRQPTPTVDALRGTTGEARRHYGTERIRLIVPRRHAFEPRAVLPVGPREIAGEQAVVHPPLQQLAVADVNRLGDHVGIGVLGHAGVDQAGMVLGVHILLDATTRAADADGVVGGAVAGDESVLHHHRRLTADDQVVVRAGLGAGRVGDGIPETESVVVQHPTPARVTLVVADGDAHPGSSR